MTHLIIYLHVTDEVFTLVPDELLLFQDSSVRVIDLDTRSAKEVIQTVNTAMDHALQVILAVNISSETENCSPLFPVLKKAVKKSVQWLQVGKHDQLGIFHKLITPVMLEDEQELISMVSSLV